MAFNEKPVPDASSRFATTHWSVVLAARRGSSARSGDALARLCESYWYPLYAYIRRQGHTCEDAQELTQEFFLRFLEKDGVQPADPERGRFRSYLLAAVRHFLANEWDRQRALKRGGAAPKISIDLQNAERRYILEPAQSLTAEKIYERRWALELLERVRVQMKDEFSKAGKTALHDRLNCFVAGETSSDSYASAATDLGITEAAVKMAVQRMRKQYRRILREEIAHTVSGESDIEDEIRHLFAALAVCRK